MRVGGAAVDFATVSDLHYCDDVRSVIDRIDNAIVSLPNSILIVPGKLFAT